MCCLCSESSFFLLPQNVWRWSLFPVFQQGERKEEFNFWAPARATVVLRVPWLPPSSVSPGNCCCSSAVTGYFIISLPAASSLLSCCPPVLLPSPCSWWLGLVEWQFFIFACLLPSWPLLLTSRLEQQWLKPWDFVNLGSFEQQQRRWSSISRKWCCFIFLLGVATWKCYLCNHGSWTLCLIEVRMLCNWIGSPWEEFAFLRMC